MNRKDAAMVFEADERVDIAARQQESAQRRAAVVGREAGRQHETDAAARPSQRDRALAEQLVAVGMSVGLRRVDAGVAREPQDAAGIVACRRWLSARIMSHGGLPEHGVESAIGQACAVGVEEHLGTLELPMKEPMCRGDFFRGAQILAGDRCRQRSAAR